MSEIATIYLIDDSELDNLYHKIVIEKSCKKIPIITFVSPEEALEYFIEHPSKSDEVLVVDINMPRMSGFEFVEKFSEMVSQSGEKPIVVMASTSSNPADIEKSQECPLVRRYVTKPLSLNFVNEIKEIRLGGDSRRIDSGG